MAGDPEDRVRSPWADLQPFPAEGTDGDNSHVGQIDAIRRSNCPVPHSAAASIRAKILGMVEFVTIRRGWFLMGSDEGQQAERPVHRVWVDTFKIGVYPVTCGEYAVFLNETGFEHPREWDNPVFRRPDRPVVGVSWDDAQAYCAWRSRRHDAVRLPTEAEWERAARGGPDKQRYPWGETIPDWVPNSGRGPLEGPWSVTLGTPNRFGLHGIAANIHEWCADWHTRDFYAESPALNPVGPDEGRRRASRGGAWRHAVTMNRTAARSSLDPSFRYTDYGFRLARSIAPS